MVKKNNAISIIVPTYTGEETIQFTLDSIIEQQKVSKINYEIIVIIDGINNELKKVIKQKEEIFKDNKIPFRAHQFANNKGRFEARVKGAELAKYSRLLFIDDRVELEKDYLSKLTTMNEECIVPNVIEVEDSLNFISITISAIRKKTYGNKWGNSFDDYYITKSNFEKSSKGTTSLVVEKDIFLKACQLVKKAYAKKDVKNISDDTKILKEIMLITKKGLLRTSRLKIFYRPRTNFRKQTKHLYERGPKFVDYYLQPGTRFFYPLIIFYIAILVFVVLTLINWKALLVLVISLVFMGLLLSIFLGKGVQERRAVFFAVPVIIVLFSLGLLKGLLIATSNKLK